MSGMLDRVGSFFETTLGNMPLAVLTIALLATPTLIYLIYRLSVPSTSHGKGRSAAPATAQWVCPRCRSVNDLQSSRCYHCEFRVDDAGEDLLVIDSVTAKPIVLPAPVVPEHVAVAVGPGPAQTPAPVPFNVSSGPGVPVGPGPAPTVPTAVPSASVGPIGQPARTVVAAGSIGGVVGARRPFDASSTPDAAPATVAAAVAAPAAVAVAPPPEMPPPAALAPAMAAPIPEIIPAAVGAPPVEVAPPAEAAAVEVEPVSGRKSRTAVAAAPVPVEVPETVEAPEAVEVPAPVEAPEAAEILAAPVEAPEVPEDTTPPVVAAAEPPPDVVERPSPPPVRPAPRMIVSTPMAEPAAVDEDQPAE